MKVTMLESAAHALLVAYARGEANGGSMNWEDVDLAFAFAKRAMPGAYRKILREIEEQL